MRFLYFLLITFIFAACGNQKIRFVRANTEKQKVIEISENPTSKKPSETAYASEKKQEKSATENNRTTTAGTVVYVDEDMDEAIIFSEELASSFPETVQDSTEKSAQELEDIADQALKAEDQGTSSLVFALLILAFALLTIVTIILGAFGNFSIVPIILSILFAFLTIGSGITSIIFGAKSLNAAYNTPQGRKRAVTGIFISSILLGLILLPILFNLFI